MRSPPTSACLRGFGWWAMRSDSATIYALCAPDDGAIRYVGCTRVGAEQRLRRHLRRASGDGRTPKDAWLRMLLRNGLRPAVRVLEVVPIAEMFAAERRWVAALAHYDLLNATRGGPGMTGYSPSAATRAKLRGALLGRALSPETRRRMSAARTGIPRGPLSDDHRASLAAAQRRRFEDPAERERVGAASRGRSHSVETRQRMRVAQQARRAAEQARRASEHAVR